MEQGVNAMRYMIIILLLSGCSAMPKGELWTDDKVANGLMIAANTVIVADWAQTRYQADSDAHYECGLAKSFIGSTPTTGQVNRHFVSALITYNTINYILPARWKKVFSAAIVSIQLIAINDNISVGVGMEF